MSKPIRILIVDDHALFRNGVKALLETEPGVELVAEASNGEEAINLARTKHPDVILMDLVLPVMDGITAISRIRAFTKDIRILVLSNYLGDDKSLSAIQAGASGYISKDCTPGELLHAIRQVVSGQSYLTPEMVNCLVEVVQQKPETGGLHLEPLTARENEVLKLIALGLSNDKIADTLKIAKRTVSTHINNILNKLHLESRAQAVIYALQNRII